METLYSCEVDFIFLVKIFPVGLEDHAITISSAVKYAIYVFFVDHEIRGVAGDPLVILHQTLQRW
ncbi:hypothetical protein LAZ67_1001971 [Cordylochernes scorpioides]|uniref:Uncharacterized protein n=1 Tax=Cordylochernes scorpioides TaxID=51811 RepID=A0ABY6JYI3_9ARAC|nr:hypothetical protein LAZ67_1001971 [Cordylochernes scorpioides]